MERNTFKGKTIPLSTSWVNNRPDRREVPAFKHTELIRGSFKHGTCAQFIPKQKHKEKKRGGGGREKKKRRH